MKKFNFHNRGQSLIGIIIVLVAVGLIGGSLYYYLSKQIPEVPEIMEKTAEEVVAPEKEVVAPPPKEELPEEELPEEELPEEEIIALPCQDECSPAGSKRCSKNGYQACGNYDEDLCLEWSSIINCPTNTICRNGICEEEFKPYIEGIILVNKNNNYSSFVENLAKERKWYLLKTNSSGPAGIRQDIITVTDNNIVDYLLIIGDETQIPIADPDFLEEFLSSQGIVRYEIGNNVLDSIYYGNIDNDPFVELAVGRLPFSDQASVENYFLNLNRNKDIQNVIAFRPLTTPGPHPMMDIRKNFLNFQVNNFITESLNTDQVSNYLENSDLFLFFTHGSKDTFAIDGGYNWQSLPDLSRRKPIVISGACLTARGFGKEFVRKGGTAFVGYYFEAEADPNVFPIRPLNSEDSIGKSIRDVINKNIARYKWKPKEFFPSFYYLIGDPSIKIRYPEINKFSKLTFELTKNKITIKVPPYEKEITYEVFDDGEMYLSIDGKGSVNIENLGLDLYKAVVNKKYFLVDNSDFVKYMREPRIFIECDPNKESKRYQCYKLNETLSADALARFDIEVPYAYVIEIRPGGNFFVFKLNRSYNISDFYLEVEGKQYSLSKHSNYRLVAGNQENFLVIEFALNDFFDLIHNGRLFKEKKIILTIE